MEKKPGRSVQRSSWFVFLRSVGKLSKASAEVMQVLSLFSDCIERASIDEAYLDITERVKDKIQQMGFGRITSSMLPCTHVAGFSPDVAPYETAPSALLSVDHPQSLLSLWLNGDGSAEELCLAVGDIQVHSRHFSALSCSSLFQVHSHAS